MTDIDTIFMYHCTCQISVGVHYSEANRVVNIWNSLPVVSRDVA